MKNLSLKIWSLIIALLISYFVNSQTNSGLVTLIVPVELTNMPVNKVVLLPNSSQAQITFRAPSHLLSEIVQSPPSFSLRVPEEIGNRYVVSLQSDALDVPRGVDVLNIEPAEIEYILDDIVEKKLPVVVPRIGDLDPGYLIESLVIEPKEVNLSGPTTELKSLTTVQTAPLDLRPLHQSSEKLLSVRIPGRFVKSSTERISVKIRIAQEQREKSFTKIPIVVVGKSANQYTATPTTLRVEVSGPKSSIEKLQAKDIQASVAIESSAKEKEELPVTVIVPESISIIDKDPQKVVLQKKK